jgi:hypothetical protein
MTLRSDTDGQSPNIDLTRQELREGIETSREIVRQTRMLIELSECDGASSNENDDRGFAN